MRRMLLAVSAATLLAGTTIATAQVWDDPPGYRSYRGYDAYGAYGAYRDDSVIVRTRPYVRRDAPPGSRFQDRGIDEDLGRSPLRRGH
jgi:hypothetical protein